MPDLTPLTREELARDEWAGLRSIAAAAGIGYEDDLERLLAQVAAAEQEVEALRGVIASARMTYGNIAHVLTVGDMPWKARQRRAMELLRVVDDRAAAALADPPAGGAA